MSRKQSGAFCSTAEFVSRAGIMTTATASVSRQPIQGGEWACGSYRGRFWCASWGLRLEGSRRRLPRWWRNRMVKKPHRTVRCSALLWWWGRPIDSCWAEKRVRLHGQRRTTIPKRSTRARRRARASRVSTPGQAASEARRAFPDLIEQPAGGPPRLPLGSESLVIDRPRGAGVSSRRRYGRDRIACAHRRQDGARPSRPTRPTPGRSGRAFSARASRTSDVEVPKNLSSGVSLSGTGVSLTPVDRHGSPLAGSDGCAGGLRRPLGRHRRRRRRSARPGDARQALARGLRPDEHAALTAQPRGAVFPGRHARRAPLEAAQGRIGADRRRTAPRWRSSRPSARKTPKASRSRSSTSVHGDITRLTRRTWRATTSTRSPSTPKSTTLSWRKRPPASARTGNSTRATSAALKAKPSMKAPAKNTWKARASPNTRPAEWAYWGYQTNGVSHIYEMKTETSAQKQTRQNRKLLGIPGTRRSQRNQEDALKRIRKPRIRKQSHDDSAPPTPRKSKNACPARAKPKTPCTSSSRRPARPAPTTNSQTRCPRASSRSPSRPARTRPPATTRDLAEFEFEAEVEGKKEKIKRKNALFGTGTWLTKLRRRAGTDRQRHRHRRLKDQIRIRKRSQRLDPAGRTQLPGSRKRLPGRAVLRNATPNITTLPTGLPDGEQKLRYKAEEAMSGTQSLESEGQATVKVDTAAPHRRRNRRTALRQRTERTSLRTDRRSDRRRRLDDRQLGHQIDRPVRRRQRIRHRRRLLHRRQRRMHRDTRNGRSTAPNSAPGKHEIVIVALDNAGNEARHLLNRLDPPLDAGRARPRLGRPGVRATSRSAPTDVSMGSGPDGVAQLQLARRDCRATTARWARSGKLSLGSTESLEEMVDGSVLLTAGDGQPGDLCRPRRRQIRIARRATPTSN